MRRGSLGRRSGEGAVFIFRAVRSTDALDHAAMFNSRDRTVQLLGNFLVRRSPKQSVLFWSPGGRDPVHTQDSPFVPRSADAGQRMSRPLGDLLVRQFPQQRQFAGFPNLLMRGVESYAQVA